MKSKSTLGLVVLVFAGALVLGSSLALGSVKHADSYPGTASTGKSIFIADCGKCHTLQAAGSNGTLGPNFDHLPGVTFTVVVNAVLEGAGGIDAEYAIHSVCTGGLATKCLTMTQVNDVAKFVITKTGRPAYTQKVAQPVPT